MPNDNYILTPDGNFVSESELYHYGVKGMKWGVRKAQKKYAELDRKKAVYKKAKKEYNKSFNKAYNRALAAYSPFEKHRKANDKRWDDAVKKAEKLNAAKKDLKDIKKEVRKNTTVGQKIGRGMKTTAKASSKLGQLYVADLLWTGGKGTKAVESAVKTIGMASITAYTMARGGYDIKWYDKQGRRVG